MDEANWENYISSMHAYLHRLLQFEEAMWAVAEARDDGA